MEGDNEELGEIAERSWPRSVGGKPPKRKPIWRRMTVLGVNTILWRVETTYHSNSRLVNTDLT
jgi:hypothetical protein